MLGPHDSGQPNPTKGLLSRCTCLPTTVQQTAHAGLTFIVRFVTVDFVLQTKDRRPKTKDQRPKTKDLLLDSNRAHKLLESFANLVSDCAEHRQSGRLIALCRGRILKAPMNSLGSSGKYWTILIRVIADRNHVIERLSNKQVDVFREVVRNVDANLFHDVHRLGPDLRRTDSCANYFKILSAHVSQQAFGHLASC